MSQLGSPASAFSLTCRRTVTGPGDPVGAARAAPAALVHAAAAADTAAATRPRKARRERSERMFTTSTMARRERQASTA
jgi:hypothetical protein